jgi:hypothetical protein
MTMDAKLTSGLTEDPLPAFDPELPNMTFPVALLWKITQLPQATIAVIEDVSTHPILIKTIH